VDSNGQTIFVADAHRIGELAPVARPLQIVAEIQAVHSRNLIASVRFDNLTRPIRVKL
jgi:hypothetical protein